MPDMKHIERTMDGLRDVLFQTLEDLRDGKIEPGKATAICGVVNTVLKSAQVELQAEALRCGGKVPKEFGNMRLVSSESPGVRKLRSA